VCYLYVLRDEVAVSQCDIIRRACKYACTNLLYYATKRETGWTWKYFRHSEFRRVGIPRFTWCSRFVLTRLYELILKSRTDRKRIVTGFRHSHPLLPLNQQDASQIVFWLFRRIAYSAKRTGDLSHRVVLHNALSWQIFSLFLEHVCEYLASTIYSTWSIELTKSTRDGASDMLGRILHFLSILYIW